jgi:hypothetical protein
MFLIDVGYNEAQLYYRIVSQFQFEEQENFPINPDSTAKLYKVPPGYTRTISTSSGVVPDLSSSMPVLKGMRPGLRVSF